MFSNRASGEERRGGGTGPWGRGTARKLEGKIEKRFRKGPDAAEKSNKMRTGKGPWVLSK